MRDRKENRVSSQKSRSKKLAWLAGIAIVCGIVYYGRQQTVKPVEPIVTTGQQGKRPDSLAAYAKSVMDKNHLAGAIGIVRNGKLTTVTSGMADLKKRIPNSSKQVVYPIGSMQKEITGAMVMQVMREKAHTDQAFSQDTKIARWYPNLKHADQVTVGNLLTHTSGYAVPTVEYARHQEYTDLGAVAWTISKIDTTDQLPAGSYIYSDVNFILLAGIIKKETGKSYSQNFYDRVAKPLKLTHTYIRQDLPKKLHLAVSYRYVDPNYYQSAISYAVPVSTQLPGAGNLVSTPADFYKIQLGLENGQLLTEEEFSKMTHLKAKKTLYSGGVYLKKHETIHLAYGTLDKEHYGAYMQLTADNKNGIIMLINQRQQSERKLKRIAFQILKRIKARTFSLY